jgi:hypothetical protein
MGERDEKPPLVRGEPRLLHLPRGDDELLAEEHVLRDELSARTSHVAEQPADDRARARPRAGPHGRCQAFGCPARHVAKAMNQGVEHQRDVHDRAAPFKSCAWRIPERFCGGREE